MVLHVSLFITILIPIILLTSTCRSTKDDDYRGDTDSYDESHSKTESSDSQQVKRKWGSDMMGLWGKRFKMDGANDYDAREDKRKWTSGNMGMWGKRWQTYPSKKIWDSRGMGMWGKKRSAMKSDDYYDVESDDHVGDIVINNEKRRWGQDGSTVWGKRLDSAINQIRSQKSKWASGSMGMWG